MVKSAAGETKLHYREEIGKSEQVEQIHCIVFVFIHHVPF